LSTIAGQQPDSVTTTTFHSEKLSPLIKLAFGVGDLGPAIVSGINGFFLNAFLLDVAGLRPAMAGTIFLIVKIWDAVNDPLLGSLSDRTRTRWGRRRPWLLFGAVPFGLFFFVQWLVPPLGDVAKFWYYLIIAVLLALRLSVSAVPAGILLVSFLAVRAYPITRERHSQMRAELQRRNASAKAS